MNQNKIKKSVERIKKEAEAIEEEVSDKTARTYGDPVCSIEY